MPLIGNPIGILQTGSITSPSTSSSVLVRNAAGFCVQAAVSVPGSVTGASIRLEASLDGINFETIDDSTQAITVTDNYIYNYNGPFFDYMRVVFEISSGSMTVVTLYSVKRPI